jgi:hypothetical protein
LETEVFVRLRDHIQARQRELTGLPEPAAPPLPVVVPSVPTPPAPVSEEILEALPVVEPSAVTVPVVEAHPLPVTPIREAHPLPAAPIRPRRTLAEWLGAFMEERNILWGELVGGLLMVGCSIALVISLWHTLEQIFLFPFLVLASVTVVLFGVGQYTLHHWKLTSTSRGLLVIATLLVPLNFLVLAGLSQGEAGGVLELGTKLTAVAGFAWLVHRAAKVLLPGADTSAQLLESLLLALAVVGATASQLPVHRLVDPLYPGAWFVMLAAWAVACHGLSVGGVWWRRTRSQALGDSAAGGLLGFLGLATFALVMALGFLGFWVASRGGPLDLALEKLAVLVTLAGVPVLVVGLSVRHAMVGADRGSTGSHLSLSGTVIGLVGALVMLTALVLAWPNPAALLLVCLLNAVVLIGAALAFRLPLVHAPALLCLSVGYLTAYHLGAGHLADLLREERAVRLAELTVSSSSGAALAALVALVIAAALQLVRKGRPAEALVYRVGGCALAVLSILLVGLGGVREPGQATLIYALYAVGGLFLSRRWQWAWLEHAGAVLLVGATLWGLHWGWPGNYPFWGFALALEALLFSVVRGRWWAQAAAVGLLALATTLPGPGLPVSGWQTLGTLALAAAAFLQAGRWRVPALTWLGSGLVLVGIGHALLVRFPEYAPSLPALATVLLHATLVQSAGFFIRSRQRHRDTDTFAIPLGQTALASLLLGCFLLLFQIEQGEMVPRAVYGLWLAGLFLAHTLIERRPQLFPVFQAVLCVAVLLGVANILVEQSWVRDRYPAGLFDPRSLHGFALGLTGLGLVWGILRLTCRSRVRVQALLEFTQPALDRVVLGLLVIGQAALALLWGLLPSILREMTPAGFQVPDLASWAEHDPGVFESSAWLLLAGLAVTLLVWLWEARTAARLTAVSLGLLLVALTVPVLTVGPFVEHNAAASALRWGLAICFVTVSLSLWWRERLARLAGRLGIFTDVPSLARINRSVLVASTVLPVVGLSVWMALVVLAGAQPGGPDATSFFSRIGSLVSHMVPLCLVLLGLTGHALRERSQGYAFAGGLVANLIVTGGYALGIVEAGGFLGAPEGVFLLQLSTLTAALWGIGWLVVTAIRSGSPVLGDWLRPLPVRPLSPSFSLLALQIFLGMAGSVLMLALPLPRLLLHPADFPTEGILAIGQGLGWFALGFAALAAVGYSRRQVPQLQKHVLSGAAVAAGVLAACTLAGWDQGNWLAYHTLMLAWTLAAWGLAIVDRKTVAKDWHNPWVQFLGLCVVVLAVRGAWTDPARPYTSFAVLAISLLSAFLALRVKRPEYVVSSGLLIELAGVLAWIAVGPDTLPSFVAVNVLGLALASSVWTVLHWIERTRSRVEQIDDRFVLDFTRPFRHGAALVSAVVLAGLAAGGLLSLTTDYPLPATGPLVWSALVATALALALCGWDARARFPLPALYGLGLAGVALVLQNLDWTPPALARAGMLMLAGHVLLTAVLAGLARRLAWWRTALRFPPTTGEALSWFAPTQAGVAWVAVLISLFVAMLHSTTWARLSAPWAVSMLIPAGVYLASQSSGSWRRQLTRATLALGVLLLAEVGWALIDPTASAPWLHRSAAVLTAMALMTVVYGFGLPRLLPAQETWARESRQVGRVLGLLSCAVIVLVVFLEGLAFDPVTKQTPLGTLEIATVLIGLAALMTAGLAFAVAPHLDPFGLSERGRRYYVYASELLLVFLFLHLRFNVPWLFPARLGAYWSFLVMAVAFLGVGLSEFFRRRQLSVLAEPLQRTGMFLPLLPLLIFWLVLPLSVRERAVEVWPGGHPLLRYFPSATGSIGPYASLWFLSGLLYAWVAVTRRSFRYGLLAALASNAGLWVLLYGYGPGLFAHPQVWLIPLALIILVSEVINRPQLSPEWSNGLRYLGLGMLYLSSTADLFITGLGQSVILPLVLAVLSILGVLAGILFRIRSYLYLGVGFLVLDIFSMIWHAAVDLQQTWIWWVSGIVLGAAILALFALFENRRLSLQRVVERFRTWQ